MSSSRRPFPGCCIVGRPAMEVVVHQFEGVSTMRALPLAAGLVTASARRDPRLEGARFAIQTERVHPDAAAGALAAPDVLAFSAYVWNERYSLEVARRARARFPGAFVVVGGPSTPRAPDRAAAFLRANPAVDALVIGEGELTFRDLLVALRRGQQLDEVPGLALRASARPEGAVLTAPRPRMTDFGEAASPYLDTTFDALAGDAPVQAAILETNRGCPFACTFCDWGAAIASRVHELPLERVYAELAWIARRRVPYLYIVDANYGMRRRDVDIIREIGRLKVETGFPRYVFFHLTKNATERHLDVVLALREAGIATHLALSAQDFEERVLVAIKRDNIRLDRALALRRICHERGIPTINELILGLPEQTYDSFANSMVKAVTPFPGDSFQLYLARVLENAEMASAAERERHAIETRSVAIASFHHAAESAHVPELEEVVVATRAMPVADWRRAYAFGYFLAAANNLRLLDVVVQVSARVAGPGVRALVEGLLARAAAAPAGSALAAVHAVLDRHADAVLAGRAMVLPSAGAGDHLWAVEDAVAVAVLGNADRFYAEVEDHVRATGGAELLIEAVRYQRLVTPTPGGAPRAVSLTHDFEAWRALPAASDGPPVPAQAVEVSFTPSPTLAAAPDLRAFVLGYLGAAAARVPFGAVITRPAPEPPTR